MSGYRFTKMMLSKYIFFMAIVMMPSIAISDVKKTNDVVLDSENTEVKQWKEFHTKQIIVELNEPELRCVSILIERKKNFRANFSEDEFHSYLDEMDRIYDFINGLTGNVSIYNHQGIKIVLIYKQNMPLGTFNNRENIPSTSVNVGNYRLSGLELFCIKTTPGRYFILSDLYSRNDKYDDYILLFSNVHYDK